MSLMDDLRIKPTNLCNLLISESLSLENTLWSNTVLTSGSIIGLVIAIGKETKTAMNSSSPRTKLGYLDI
jgi:phospholipid-translocating ATPase